MQNEARPHRTELQLDGSKATFEAEVGRQIASFERTKLVTRVESNSVSMAHYHAILATLFHQARSSPYTFALAGANCSWKHEAAKEYLIQHAEEERRHWHWILDDLRNTGYSGTSPLNVFPHATCEAYISFNERVANCCPVARLAIASVLEGIGAQYGAKYGGALILTLQLDVKQASFFISHGETDKTHIEDLAEVIGRCELNTEEWGWMTHAARMAGTLYCAMFNHDEFD